MKKQVLILLAVISLIAVVIFSCRKKEELPDTSGYDCVSGNCALVSSGADYASLAACQSACGGSSSGQIYYRTQYDLSYPTANGATSCDITPGNYTDNNNAVPGNANFNTYYGPCQPGTYNAQFLWDISASTYINFTYTLASPAPGYNRYYTQFLIDYFEGTNRCHNVTLTPSYMTYIDELQ
jgi:hypothetical protein